MLLVALCALMVASSLVPAAAARADVLPQTPVRAVFDDPFLSHQQGYYGYHGFTVLDVDGRPIMNTQLGFIATVAGPNATVSPIYGQIDSYGRGVFGYYASLAGIDTFTVEVGTATGSAQRKYGGPQLQQVSGVATRIDFDQSHTLRPTQSYQYHGFYVFGTDDQPLTYSFNPWTAVVAGPNGPLTIGGRLDQYGRGVFGYAAGPIEGTDVITVEVGAASAQATRAYEDGASFPVVPEPLLIGYRRIAQKTPPSQILLLDANVLQDGSAQASKDAGYTSCEGVVQKKSHGASIYRTKKACDAAKRMRAFAARVAHLAIKTVGDGMGFVPDVITLQETYASDARTIANELFLATGYRYTVHGHNSDFGNLSDGSAGNSGTALLFNEETMLVERAPTTIETKDPYGFERIRRHLIGAQIKKPDLVEVYANRQYFNRGRSIGTAAIHFAVGQEQKKGLVSAGNRQQTKALWFREVADELYRQWCCVSHSVIAGDFNEVRCVENPSPDNDLEGFAADDPAADGTVTLENSTCVGGVRAMHRAASERGFVDAIYSQYGATDPTLQTQYQDGLGHRRYRIDHIFARSSTIERASFDISCGLGDPNLNNCDYLSHPQRYSDHRLLWALLADGVTS